MYFIDPERNETIVPAIAAGSNFKLDSLDNIMKLLGENRNPKRYLFIMMTLRYCMPVISDSLFSFMW